ncbi:hypothetical protein BDN70DRAFT_937234 [Pholiota conissans]|uniref:DUF6699 domain-containing protein n=1 Tax=Pholiota conissans TaxID=109636 RepID=A0A9P6CV09_9AGAR|nr:hypothetical protein BDN70DRAFT_937234 [Pholiota conissans]
MNNTSFSDSANHRNHRDNDNHSSRFSVLMSQLEISDTAQTSNVLNPHLSNLPPLLPVIPSISLPPLSSHIPSQTHPLITSTNASYANIPILWNISHPPSTARLAPEFNSAPNWPWWREVAIRPTTMPSMTIRLERVERPVVVFPADIGHPITIADVLRAVYDTVRTMAMAPSLGDSAELVLTPDNEYREVGYANDVSTEIQRHFQGRVWWGGLQESLNETDVWLLRLRGTGRR